MHGILSGRAVRQLGAAAALLVLAAVASVASADNLAHKAWHYVTTHTELLASQALVIAGQMADAGSTVHCMHYSPYCTEDNPALPLRPSNAQLYGYAGGLGVGACAVEQLVWHFAPHAADKQVIVWLAAPLVIGDAMQAKMNVDSLSTFQPWPRAPQFKAGR